MNTPIVLFTYKRIDTLIKVLDALKKQTLKPPILIVYSDFSKSIIDVNEVAEVRKIIKSIDWVRVELHEREFNYGCAKNIIYGLNEVFQKYDETVIVEDDVLVSPCFYETMVKMLNHYRSSKNIFSVGGYSNLIPGDIDYPVDYPYDVIISQRFAGWGWGVWADRWQRKDLLNWSYPINDLSKLILAGDDVPEMAMMAFHNPGMFWDIKILIDCISRNEYHAVTKEYLVNNIGMDSGDHGTAGYDGSGFSRYYNPMSNKIPMSFPEPKLDMDVVMAINRYINMVVHKRWR